MTSSKAMPLNDVRSIGCNNFSTFINRIEFMNPFLPASWQIKNGTDDRMEKYAESWRKKKEILQDTTGMPFPVVGELIPTRSYPFLAKTLENEKKAFALLDTLKGYLHDPFPGSRSRTYVPSGLSRTGEQATRTSGRKRYGHYP